MPLPFLYALKKTPRYRKQLNTIAHDPSSSAKTVLDINLEALKQRNIKVIALDYDGVLAHHSASQLSAPVISWLQQCCDTFGEDHVYIHSNNNKSNRLQYFAEHFPKIRILKPTHKKPFPEGLASITADTGIAPEHIVLVDDRLTTGILATCLAGTAAIHINQPYINFHHSPAQEAFFCLLRWLEKTLIA